MPDIIQLLPDMVANQIAAGEVIQRPASAVKELMENAVDAGGTFIRLIVKDAGKSLVQVIDNGCGMSGTDARMSFERHATSKIRKAEDLFAIRTMGFRGEALASIAAIAQVELKTKRAEDETGTQINIEASEVISQEACSCSEGTSISVKNLFYNIPARRNFLKSDTVELRHIFEEFQRVALAHPEIGFTLHSNNNEVFNLPAGNFRQRLSAVFGGTFNERLVPVEEDTDIIKITGFICKPEFAKRTRGEQYFFINKRFIKNGYLQHAIQTAFEQMLPAGSFASYFLMMDIDPKTIDINIHPTKTEIKFEDERSIYAILRSAVKKSLGQYNITPTLDFEQEMSFNIPLKPANGIVQPTIQVNPDFNPFKLNQDFQRPVHAANENANKANWEKLYSSHSNSSLKPQVDFTSQHTITSTINETISPGEDKISYQLHNKYILAHIKSGFMVIDQQGAHERILYEKYMEAIEKQKGNSQQQLFPQTVEFSASDSGLIRELSSEIRSLGFDLSEMGNNTFAINGLPSETANENGRDLVEGVLENYKQNLSEIKHDKKENLARSMAKKMSVKSGKSLKAEEMTALVDELFACKMPYSTPGGKPTIVTFSLEDLDRRFKK
jgi:DNA mismatch repair protein MutL